MIHKIITHLPPSKQKFPIDILDIIELHRLECKRIMTSSVNNFVPIRSDIVDHTGKPGKEFLVTFINEEVCATK